MKHFYEKNIIVMIVTKEDKELVKFLYDLTGSYNAIAENIIDPIFLNGLNDLQILEISKALVQGKKIVYL